MQADRWTWRCVGLLILLGLPGGTWRRSEALEPAAKLDPAGEGQGEEDPIPTVRFLLDDASGLPGDVVTLHFSVFTEVPLASLSVAINFDESRVRLLDVRYLENEAAADVLSVTRIDNRDEVEGDQTREGYVHVEVSSAQDDRSVALGANKATPLLEFDFKILEDARPGLSEVSFADIGPIPQLGPSVVLVNAVEVDGAVAPRDADLLDLNDFRHGSIDIIGEVGFFMRGDTNLDCERDLTDAVITLNWLFVGGSEPRCLDAADANDSGTLDLSDALYTLTWLYMGGPPFSEPFATVGEDPTEDGLDCADGLSEEGCPGSSG